MIPNPEILCVMESPTVGPIVIIERPNGECAVLTANDDVLHVGDNMECSKYVADHLAWAERLVDRQRRTKR